MKNKSRYRRSGVALVSVLCFAAILAGLLAILMMAVCTHLRIAGQQVDFEKSLYVAQAGAERGAAYIVQGGTVPGSFSGTLGDGVYCVAIVAGSSPAVRPHSVAGQININPNNNPDNEFFLMLPNGSTVTRDDLHQDYPGYNGEAVHIHVKPKGNGNQNGLVVDGQTFEMSNSKTYDVLSATMSVNLYNDHINPQGKAVGQWWIAAATTDATVSEAP